MGLPALGSSPAATSFSESESVLFSSVWQKAVKNAQQQTRAQLPLDGSGSSLCSLKTGTQPASPSSSPCTSSFSPAASITSTVPSLPHLVPFTLSRPLFGSESDGIRRFFPGYVVFSPFRSFGAGTCRLGWQLRRHEVRQWSLWCKCTRQFCPWFERCSLLLTSWQSAEARCFPAH